VTNLRYRIKINCVSYTSHLLCHVGGYDAITVCLGLGRQEIHGEYLSGNLLVWILSNGRLYYWWCLIFVSCYHSVSTYVRNNKTKKKYTNHRQIHFQNTVKITKKVLHKIYTLHTVHTTNSRKKNFHTL